MACTDVMMDPDWLLDRSATKNIEISTKLPLKNRIEIDIPTLNTLNDVLNYYYYFYYYFSTKLPLLFLLLVLNYYYYVYYYFKYYITTKNSSRYALSSQHK